MSQLDSASTPSPRVLFIDDSQDQRFILDRFLQSGGFEARSASSGEEGLELASREKPDLVLVDILMPGLSGFDTCKRLLALPGMSSTPVIFLTASRDEEDRNRAFSVGASDFLHKPVAKDKLLSKVRSALRKRTHWNALETTVPGSGRLSYRYREFLEFVADRLNLDREGRARLRRGAPSKLYSDLTGAGVDEADSLEALALFFDWPVCDSLEGLGLRLGVLPTAFCRLNLVLPVEDADGRASYVVANPFDHELLTILADRGNGEEPGFLLASPNQVRVFFSELTGESLPMSEDDETGREMEEILNGLTQEEFADVDAREEEPELSEDDGSVVRLVHGLILDARRKGASDVHIEPGKTGDVQVRYRIDGKLHKAWTFARALRHAVPSRLKVMSGMDIAEKRRPQSGKIDFSRFSNTDLELRMETYPNVFGSEDTVLRLLASNRALPLTGLGLRPDCLEKFTEIVEKPYGLILCAGPTGSGKTTTLHSALSHVNREDVKILTAEDPVEITQPGLRQVQVNAKSGLSFASALRSFLRADPDVIMIGEMRDRETAATAVEASLTGHLVLSTLHTNTAPETVVRMVNMGVDPFSFADSLLGVLAQRLVRTLCGKCKRPLDGGEEEMLGMVRTDFGDDERFDRYVASSAPRFFLPSPEGCTACNGHGFKGRIAMHELLIVDEAVRDLIGRSSGAGEIRAAATGAGMSSLKQDGLLKILSGQTTLSEVRAVCGR